MTDTRPESRLVAAIRNLGRYDDWHGELCPACAPKDPTAYIAAREEVAYALDEYDAGLWRFGE